MKEISIKVKKDLCLMKLGNAKIGRDTIIFNMTSATECPSKRLGLCQLANTSDCYAYRAEQRFPTTLNYRQRQAVLWEWSTAFDIALIISAKRTKNVRYVRINESGDFTTQKCVDKLFQIARMLPDLIFYGYTARKDLDFEKRPDNVSICGSNWSRGNMNKFVAVKEYSGKNVQCFGDCSKCNLCKVEKGLTIEIEMHGPRYNWKIRRDRKK